MGVSENSVPHLPNGFADHYPYEMAISLGIYPIFLCFSSPSAAPSSPSPFRQVYEARAQALDFPGGAPHLCIFPSIAGLSAQLGEQGVLMTLADGRFTLA